MTDLAPWVVQIPPALSKDPATKKWAEYLHKHLQDMNVILQFGGAITNITNSESFETSSTSAEYQSHKRILEQTEDLIPVTRQSGLLAIAVNSNYSASNGEFIDASNGSTITLIPSTRAVIHTSNADGSRIRIYSDIEFHHNGQVDNCMDINSRDTGLTWYLFETDGKQYWKAS